MWSQTTPESYYSVSRRLTAETPGAFNPNQYANQGNPRPTTTPPARRSGCSSATSSTSSWAASAPVGPCTGIGRYLKERNPSLQIVGADPEGSIYSSPEVRPYLIEGVGEDFWPTTFDPALVDRWIPGSATPTPSTPRAGWLRDGILAGGSCGHGPARRHPGGPELDESKTVLVPPDGGRPYLSKVFDDNWMSEHGLLERPQRRHTVAELLLAARGRGARHPVAGRGRRRQQGRGGDRAPQALRHLADAGRPGGQRRADQHRRDRGLDPGARAARPDRA